jgi:hypothetical protein
MRRCRTPRRSWNPQGSERDTFQDHCELHGGETEMEVELREIASRAAGITLTEFTRFEEPLMRRHSSGDGDCRTFLITEVVRGIAPQVSTQRTKSRTCMQISRCRCSGAESLLDLGVEQVSGSGQ